MQQLVHRIWYQRSHPLRWLLVPLSGLFALISSLRRLLFRLGIKKSWQSPVPLIIVGNITAGGSGKTPMVLHLITLLSNAGYKPGVVSRGYGAQDLTKPKQVDEDSKAIDVGDEPAMIFARTQVPIVVGANRTQAIKHLLSCSEVNVIICDDGLQHYALKRDIELAIIDGKRALGNGLLLPAGPLRENSWRLNQVDFVVINGIKNDNYDWQHIIRAKKSYSMTLETDGLHPVLTTKSIHGKHFDNIDIPLTGENIVAMAGIGNPQRFFDTLIQLGFKLNNTTEFDDHKAYELADIAPLSTDFPMVMTEKDAIKCRDFAQPNWWYLAVNATLDKEFDKKLLDKLAKVAANRQGK